ncbi:NADPH-dependent FMN reductase [Picosynechococcus sp. PCC 8807]|uniref:NADPH-dependent FMN reductase n=1 Tax=Picosynechococcus sp. PCC 8807 TaxID=195248 RepID=UPI0008109D2C|nr:NAD(P)H-dependent oxidoreductase [Picosynechococcus sp. PCC 8807]ANV91403.1 flavoprotein [Picosynechococcus sp. PCC 8807]
MSYLIIGASLNPESRSQILAEQAQLLLQNQGKSAQWLDLRKLDLPFCAGRSTYDHPSLPPLNEMVTEAEGIIVATPIYNYDVNAALKNFLELTGQSWQEKTVGFLCAAGGKSSYMSVMSFANNLMLDFRCLIVPRFVYATREAFAEGKIIDETIETRLAELVHDLVRITEALNTQ